MQSLKLSAKTLIMGILNVTPDSFYQCHGTSATESVSVGLKMASDGADIIDVGGESTRPGSEAVECEEEIKRIIPVISELSKKIDIPISVDTYKAAVARAALNAGASIVNDISGFMFDKEMAATVAGLGCPVVIMHTGGRPKDMQNNTNYQDLMKEILDSLQESIGKGKDAGIKEENFIVDPGIGFGKKPEHNFEILRKLSELKKLGHPILVGPSRKSFIGHVLDLPPEDRLEGTAAAVTAAILNGADIVRVHDVKAMKSVVRIADAIKS